MAAIALSLLVLSVSGGSGAALAQGGQSRAGLVLQFPGGSTQTYCVPFDGDSISGLDLLLKSGLDVKVQVYGGLGAEICEIDSTGCDYPNQACACQSYGPGGVYWSYFHLKDGQWQTSIVGAGSYKVHNGDVEGWAYSSGKPPALYTFSQVCPAPPPPPIPTDTPTRPTPTSRPPLPTLTPKPRATSTLRHPSPTPRPQPTSTEPEAATATPAAIAQATATATLTLTPTATTEASPTSTAQPTETSTPAPQPTQPSLTPTATITSAPGAPAGATGNPEDTARNVGLLIGAVVAGSLAVWGIITAAGRVTRSRNNSKGGSNVE
jgi:hypothetical protein